MSEILDDLIQKLRDSLSEWGMDTNNKLKYREMVIAYQKLRTVKSKEDNRVTATHLVCDDCDVENFPMTILKEELWLSIAMKRDRLCFNCMEKRMGRKIVWDDLKPCGVTEELKLGLVIDKNTKEKQT